MLTREEENLLNSYGWNVVGESPILSIAHQEDEQSIASGYGAKLILAFLKKLEKE